MAWLPRWLVDDADRRVIEDELAELYEIRRRTDGEDRAGRWRRRQRLIYPWQILGDRLRSALSEWRSSMSHLGRDLAYATRTLRRAPVLAATIILTVGIGLGATTAMVSVIRAVLVNPLPYANGDHIVWIYTDNPPYRFRFSVVDYRALEADHPAFDAIAGYQTNRVTVTIDGIGERVTEKDVTGAYFPMLGQKPALGRLFDPSDDARDGRMVVLTHGYWTRRFGADPSVVGRTLTVDGLSFTVVGVLEPVDGPLEHDVSVFTVAHWPTPKRKGPFFTFALGRLRPGISHAAAIDTLHATNARLFPVWRSSYQDEKATWGMLDLKARVVGNAGATLFIALTAVACVLLIACLNAVNLLVARATSRSREMGIRGALGATRIRLLQALFAESAILTVASAIVAVVVAAGTLALITTYGASYIPRLDEVRLSGPVIAWLAGLAAASGVLIGIASAVPSMRVRIDRALAGGRSGGDGLASRRIRRALVAVEFALATPLIVAAVLVLTSLDRLSHVPVGVDTSRLLTAAVQLTGASYSDDAGRAAFWTRAVERLSALPGVESAAIADSRPPAESGQQNNFDLEDHPTPAGQSQPICTWVGVSPGFFRTVGLGLVRGHVLDAHSLDDNVVVVDRAWAARFFPGVDVIGRRFHNGGCTTCPWTTVAGVVDDVKWTGLDADADGTVYFPLLDVPNAFFVLRAHGSPDSLSLALQQATRELDPSLALSEIATGEDLIGGALARPRYLGVLVTMFALTALVLSIVGIYGVMAYFVQQHTRDLGVRLALGGDPSDMRRLVIAQGLRLVSLGVGLGVVVAILAARLVASVLFGVSPTDLRTLVAVPLALVVVAAIACLIPARRAAALDPAKILRES